MFCEVHYSTYYRKIKKIKNKKSKVKGQKKKSKKKSFIKSNKIKEILVISVYCYLTVYACVNVQLWCWHKTDVNRMT